MHTPVVQPPITTVRLTVNGRDHLVPADLPLLEAIRRTGSEVPTLCHDSRIGPIGSCGLCTVQIAGTDTLVSACRTPVSDGLAVLTHPPEVEASRRMSLELLARHYPAAAPAADPDRPFHRLLNQCGVTASGPDSRPDQPAPDNSHPYLDVDMARCITCLRCVHICADLQGQDVWHVANSGDRPVIVPDSGTTLAASSCVSCGACAHTCPTGAIGDRTIRLTGPATAWTRTTCPYCGVGCELSLGTRNGRVVQSLPLRDSPSNLGHLCVKGRYAFGFNHAADRVTSPLLRRGGTWEQVSWEEAIAAVAQGLQRLMVAHGPDSLGLLGSARATNEDNYLTQKFARLVVGTNNVDCCARVCHAPTAAALQEMLGTGAATNSYHDIELAAGFMLCGTNATENHPVVGARIRQAVRRGARLVVIDPRRTELAAIADIHLALRPGTNVPLLNALACVLVEEDLFDAASVRDRLDGWDAFQGFVREYRPESVAATCGVSAEHIRRAARIFATARPAMCFHGLGLTEHAQGTEGVEALVNLALLTGNVGRPGGGVNPLRGQNNVQGSAHMGCEPGKLTGMQTLAAGRELHAAAWGAPPPDRPGLDLMQMVAAAEAGRLKGLWAIGYDVALTNPQTEATLQALRKLELVVVQDLFLNEMAAQCGTVFLPAASSFEKEGTFMNSERRVQRVRAALPPPGQSRPDWKILCDVAAALGHGARFAYRDPGEIWEEIRRVWPAGRGITYRRLEAGGLQWPCPAEDHPGTAILHIGAFTKGPRATLKRIAYRPTPETVTAEFPFLLTTGRTLYQFNAGTMTMRTDNARLRPADTLDLNPADAVRLGFTDGACVKVRSRHGATLLPMRADPRVKPGEAFATFHTAMAALNRVTGPVTDNITHTPEYKVTAVSLAPA